MLNVRVGILHTSEIVTYIYLTLFLRLYSMSFESLTFPWYF